MGYAWVAPKLIESTGTLDLNAIDWVAGIMSISA